MARRVKQADGSYCYTENCRIHDRSLSDSTGLQAVLADAKEAQRKAYSSEAANILLSTINIDEGMAHELSDQIIDTAFNSEEGLNAYMISAVLQKAAVNDPMGDTDSDNLNASYKIYNSLLKGAIIRQGDEVVLNATGERGTITEGDTGIGGVVRFNPENIHSRNSFLWFKSDEVTKISADERSLARERILAAPRHTLIPTYLVKKMIREETHTNTRNPQAAREFSKFGDAVHSKSVMLDFCDDLTMAHGDRGLTKQQLIKAMQDKVDAPYEGMVTAVHETRKAFRNILSYLDPHQ